MILVPAFGVLSLMVLAGVGVVLLLRFIRWRLDQTRRSAFARLARARGYAHEWAYPADFLGHLRFLSLMSRDARESARNVISGERDGARFRMFDLVHGAPRSLILSPYRGVVAVFEAKGMRAPYVNFASAASPLAPAEQGCDLLDPGLLPLGYCAHVADRDNAARLLDSGLGPLLASSGAEFEANGYLVAVYRAGRLNRRHLDEFHDMSWRAFELVRSADVQKEA